MSSISFYDVSIAQNLSPVMDGKVIRVNDLIETRFLQQPGSFEKNNLVRHIGQFDVYGTERPGYWERAVATMIYCISGQIPDRQEVLRGRQIIIALPKWFKKKHLGGQFVLGFLPYLLVGFKTHLEDRFQSDSNNINDVCKFIISVFEGNEVEMVSYLCAHRGFSPRGSHSLIGAVHQQKAGKTLNLQRALLANIPGLNRRKICWYQQGPTAMVSSNMFPEMFIQYLSAGSIPDLILLLERHFSESNMLLGKSRMISCEVINLDIFTSRTCAFLDAQYGTDWRITDFESSRFAVTPLAKMAIDLVIPEIKRLIPFYGDSLAKNFLKTRQASLERNLSRAQAIQSEGVTKDIILRTVKTIDWFYYNQLMHITAKALYEAAFYYVWGKTTALSKGRIAVGIDRDHAEYQSSAWNMGYEEGSLNKDELNTSILYARRVESEKPEGALRDTSFRQFWR